MTFDRAEQSRMEKAVVRREERLVLDGVLRAGDRTLSA
jgi:hypothetical protein